MKKKICFLVAFIACLFVCSPAFAFTLTEIDADGEREILLTFDDSILDVPTVYRYEIPDKVPNPNLVALKTTKLQDICYDLPIPNGASCIVFDFGPNWETVIENDSQLEVYGRYNYLFYGQYNSTFGEVRNGWGDGHSKYAYNDDTNTLTVAGPFAWVSYNVSENKLYEVDNIYGVNLATAYELEVVGCYAEGDPETESIVAFAFADDQCEYIRLGNYSIVESIYSYEWIDDWDEVGNVDTSFSDTSSFWDYIRNGWFTESDNIIVKVFTKCVQGMAAIVDIIDWAPHFFSDLVSVLPEPFIGFVKIAFSIIVTAIVIKFAFHLIP